MTYGAWFSPSTMSVLGIKLGIHSASLLPDFYKASGDLNSDLDTYKVIAVLNELLSPQASSSILVIYLSVCTQYIAALHSCYCVL